MRPGSATLSVVLATFNRRPILERTLDALQAQTRREFQIVVVDDGSTDDSWELLSQRAASSARGDGPRLLIDRQSNQGQGPARNRALRGIEATEEGLVLFLGDDILARRELVAEHLAAHAAARDRRAVVGFIDWCRDSMRVTPALEMVNREGHQFGFAHMKAGEEVPFTCFYTSNVSVRRADLGESPFHSDFRGYGWEDVELGYRLRKQSVRLFYHPAAAAEHLHPMTLRDLFARQRQVGRGLKTFLALHPELRGSALLSPPHPPGWYRIGRRLLPPMVPLLSAADRAGLPLGRRLLHRILLCGAYLGQEEAAGEADRYRPN